MYTNKDFTEYKYRVQFILDGQTPAAIFQYRHATGGRWKEAARGTGESALAALASLGKDAQLQIQHRDHLLEALKDVKVIEVQ